MGEQDFSKELRLLTPSHFTHVFQQAVPAPSKEITVLGRSSQLQYPRLGLTIPKKKVKRAVQRNRIKRIIRESFRLNRHKIPNIDIVVIGKHGLADLDNQQIFQLLDKLWIKLAKRYAKSLSHQ